VLLIEFSSGGRRSSLEVCLTEESGLITSSLYKEINDLCVREAGEGGEGDTRGARQADFKQGT
jgi:hypothetical protein